MGLYISADPYPYPFDGDLRPQNTAMMVIDMQTDFCGKGGYVDKMGYDLSLTRAPIEPIRQVMAVMRSQNFTIHPHPRRPPSRPVRFTGKQTLAVPTNRRGHR